MDSELLLKFIWYFSDLPCDIITYAFTLFWTTFVETAVCMLKEQQQQHKKKKYKKQNNKKTTTNTTIQLQVKVGMMMMMNSNDDDKVFTLRGFCD